MKKYYLCGLLLCMSMQLFGMPEAVAQRVVKPNQSGMKKGQLQNVSQLDSQVSDALKLRQSDQRTNQPELSISSSVYALDSAINSLSDRFNNALSLSGNTKTTTTDYNGTGIKTVTTTSPDGKVIATKKINRWGQVTEIMNYNPESGITITQIYSQPGKDKSSTTTIKKDNDPNYPIEEWRNEQGKLVGIFDKNSIEIGKRDQAGKLIPTKTTITALEKLTDAKATSERKLFSQDVSKAQYQAAQKLMTALLNSKNLTENRQNLNFKAFNCSQEDVNAASKTINNFEKASRATVHAQYKKLTHLRTAAKRSATDIDQDTFIQNLIEQQINNHVGVDTKTFQSKFVLSQGLNKIIVDKIKNDIKYKNLFDINSTLSEIEKLNLLADMGDVVLNTISDGIASFQTKFDNSGICTSTIKQTTTDSKNIELSSSFDNDGNLIKSRITVDTISYEKTVDNTWFYKNKKTIVKNDNETEGKLLQSRDGEFLTQSWMLNKSLVAFKLASKIALSAPKQIAINVAGFYIPAMVQGIAVAVFIPVVKIASMIPVVYQKDAAGKPEPETDAQGQIVLQKDRYGNIKLDAQGQQIPKYKVNSFVTGYQLTGHSFSDPVVLATCLKLADFAVGDNGQAFTSQAVAKVASFAGIDGMQGPLMAMGKDSPVFNPETPMAKALAKLQGKTPEQAAQEAADLNASYATIVDPIVQAAQVPFKYLFKQSLGDRILSTSDLSSVKAQPAASLDLSSVKAQPAASLDLSGALNVLNLLSILSSM